MLTCDRALSSYKLYMTENYMYLRAPVFKINGCFTLTHMHIIDNISLNMS